MTVHPQENEAVVPCLLANLVPRRNAANADQETAATASALRKRGCVILNANAN
jgi:hypothetical protein